MKKLKEIFDVPHILEPFITEILLPREIELILAMDSKKLSLHELEKLGFADKQFLEDSYRRMVLVKSEDEDSGQVSYSSTSMYTCIEAYILNNTDKWYAIEATNRHAIERWYLETYMAKKQESFKKGIFSVQIPYPLDEILKIVDDFEGPFSVKACNCRVIVHGCKNEVLTCISMGESVLNSKQDRGYSTEITKEEVRHIIIDADKAGLVHHLEGSTICNCCTCCCYPMRMYKEYGLHEKWPQIHFYAEITKGLCVSCRRCLKRCPQNAIIVKDSTYSIDREKCIGCGLCSTACKAKAIQMQKC